MSHHNHRQRGMLARHTEYCLLPVLQIDEEIMRAGLCDMDRGELRPCERAGTFQSFPRDPRPCVCLSSCHASWCSPPTVVPSACMRRRRSYSFFGFPDEIRVERSSQTLPVLFRGQAASGGRARRVGCGRHGSGHVRRSLLAGFSLVGRSGIEPAPPSGHEWWRTCYTALDADRRLESGRAIRFPFSHVRSQYCSPSSIGGTVTRSVRSRTEPDSWAGGIRTRDLRIKRPALYSAELQPRACPPS